MLLLPPPLVPMFLRLPKVLTSLELPSPPSTLEPIAPTVPLLCSSSGPLSRETHHKHSRRQAGCSCLGRQLPPPTAALPPQHSPPPVLRPASGLLPLRTTSTLGLVTGPEKSKELYVEQCANDDRFCSRHGNSCCPCVKCCS